MTDIILQGICGRMGRAVAQMAAESTDLRVVAGIDQQPGQLVGVPVYTSFDALPAPQPGCVLIDFSAPAGAVAAARWCARQGVPCVICSTGLGPAEEAVLEEAAASVPVFRSANMSVGVNVLVELAKRAAALLGEDFDIEIVEKHHRNKLDAPSGTALMVADAINSATARGYEYVYDRHAVRQKRGAKELGISAVRGGGIVGEHEVLFCGAEETLTIAHSAQSRGVFAAGALRAAQFVTGCAPGYYTMSDLLRKTLLP